MTRWPGWLLSFPPCPDWFGAFPLVIAKLKENEGA
jgi:hypothetical protein